MSGDGPNSPRNHRPAQRSDRCRDRACFSLSRIFPIVDILAAVQQRVMQWGAWSAICYPLLYACCNVLLLPGGVLSIGAGFFFGLWWGFLIALARKCSGRSDLVFHQSMDRTAMAEDENCCEIGRWLRWSPRSREKGGRSFFLVSCTSLSNQSAELSLWSDPEFGFEPACFGSPSDRPRVCFFTPIWEHLVNWA